jgi:hypothetical protein
MTNQVFSNISKIIERDSKSATYKFALLRGVIDIIQENSPYLQHFADRVYFPTGLLVEKWLIYYYPIFESETDIPQIGKNTKLAFGELLKKFIRAYQPIGGFSVFYNDLKTNGIPQHLKSEFIELVKKVRNTITNMPMKYIGRSVGNDYYSIFHYDNTGVYSRLNKATVDSEFLIKELGKFSIPVQYYDAFQLLGSFIGGQDSILFKWAEFSVKISQSNLSIAHVLNDVLRSPITEREVENSKKIFQMILKEEGQVYCVWTGKKLRSYDIDHMIPFSIWKNNDLWNLLPSDSNTNKKKRDKIPSIELIEKQQDLILHYWDILNFNEPERFQKEIRVALLGNTTFEKWQPTAINHLKRTCNYLISHRGFEEWNI